MKPLIEYDKDGILSEEVFVEIFDQEDEIEKARMLLSCQDRAKELGVKTKFDTMAKAYGKVGKATAEKKKKDNTLLENWTNFDGKYDAMKCGSWIASEDGIRTFNKDYTNEVVVCYHPILPVKRLRNLETGEEQVRLAFKRNHTWKEITVPKDLIASSNKIVTLSKLGVAVTSENARLLVKYLSDVENLNDDDIPVQKSSSKLGWIGDSFLPYDSEIAFDGDMQFKEVYESVGAHGSKMEWLNHVRQLRTTGRMEIKMLLAASFASALIKPLGCLPFIVDLWGETGGGKSVGEMLAASVWANPAEKQYIGDFKTTDVQLEVRADLLNSLPVILDDTSRTSSRIRDNFEGVIYDLCAGKGKSRSNKELGIRRENRWENVIITNGERPLTSYVSQGGAINRVMEVECGKDLFQNPQYTVDLLKHNYGYAGKQFIRAVKAMGIEEIRKMQQGIQTEIHGDEKAQKQSIALSVLITADRIATDCIFQDGQYIDLEEAKKILVDQDEISENERCYRFILDKIRMNPTKFNALVNIEQWGIIDNDGYAIMYPQAVKELCRQGNFSYNTFLHWADQQRLLATDGKNMTKPKKLNGKTVRAVWIKLNEFEDEDGFTPVDVCEEEVPSFEQEELPFS